MDLEELFDDVEDITDPDAITKVLIYVEYLQSEDEEFMEILVSQYKQMVITWEQPWYQQSNSVTRPIKIQANGEATYKTDSISKAEGDLIQENWNKLRHLLGLPDKLISFARWRNKDQARVPTTKEECTRRYVTAFLAQGLERTLYQVYKYVVTHYGCPNKRLYSPLEEKIITICQYHNPDHAVPYLSFILGREPRGLYKKINQISKGVPERKKLKWTLELATKFLKLLMDYSGTSLRKLKKTIIDKFIWLEMEKDMEQQYIYLQSFWQRTLYVQLFVKSDVKLKKLARKIFKQIKTYTYQIWSDIRWKEILKHFPSGFTHVFLYRVCYRLVRNYKNFLKAPLHDIIEYGIARSKTSIRNKRLKTLAFNENQQLELVRYPNKIEYNF